MSDSACVYEYNAMKDKKNQIVAHEESIARQLVGQVIDRPVPSVWMIFIPIFFVFYIWKIKQYAKGVKDFVENYLLSRRQALDAAFEAEQNAIPPDIDQLVKKAGGIPAAPQPLYRDWMALLVDHYCGLLSAHGNSYQDLNRAYYQDKSRYLQFCNQLNTAERAFSKTLLPAIDGDQQDLRYVLDKIDQGVADLRRKEGEEIFGAP